MKLPRRLPAACAVVLILACLPRIASAASTNDLLAAGRVDEAILSLKQQIHQSPNNAESYNLLCRAYFMIEEWDAGITNCERAVELDPTKSLYHLWLGRIYGEKADHSSFIEAAGLVKKVRTQFERAVELSPENWPARTDLAEFYYEAPGIAGGGKDKALAQAQLLEKWNPAMAHWVRGRIAEKDKDQSLAEREYRAEISASEAEVRLAEENHAQQPDGHQKETNNSGAKQSGDDQGSARAWLDLASFYRHNNQFTEMEQALATMESRPALDRPDSLMDGASMLLRSGRNFSLGERLVRRYLDSGTVEEGPAFKAHCMLGELLEKSGDRGGAEEQFRVALALAHSYRRAQEGLKRLGK